MCTRYFLSPRTTELKPIIEAAKSSPLAERFAIQLCTPVKTEGEIRPTDVVPVLAPNPRGEQAVYPMRWGYAGKTKDSKILLNARSETANQKPTFKFDWYNHRCIIPASYYFEWEHLRKTDGSTETGDRYMIQPKDSEVTWLCGLYHIEGNFPTFVVLTREPSPEIAFIHNRMPLILPSSLIGDWIRPGGEPERLMERALVEMVAEKG
jgi:putative SOS response-associated peptidase YedK